LRKSFGVKPHNQLVYSFRLISNLKPLDEYHFDFLIIFEYVF
jgi:hypothetical protein